jgi:hypothetical protein
VWPIDPSHPTLLEDVCHLQHLCLHYYKKFNGGGNFGFLEAGNLNRLQRKASVNAQTMEVAKCLPWLIDQRKQKKQ